MTNKAFSDDPWNQTAADNAEWLQRFKRDVGILEDAGPGLPACDAWSLEQGGTGFAPPYAFPKGELAPFHKNVSVSMGQCSKSFPAGQSVANSYLEDFTSRELRPATVFCSRELERGLVQFVENCFTGTGRMPSDAAIQAQGRHILGRDKTAAEDPALLQKFKDMMASKMANAEPDSTDAAVPAMPTIMDVNISDDDINNILQDMNFEFDTQDFGGVSLDAMEDVGGVSLNMSGFKD